ncbi:MAG: hypothetical protein ACE5H4_03195 [Candidatus Thorarchaeota archaeon]
MGKMKVAILCCPEDFRMESVEIWKPGPRWLLISVGPVNVGKYFGHGMYEEW